MVNFNFFFPTQIIFGKGKFSVLGEQVSRLGKRALLVTYPNSSLDSYVQQALDLLKENGVSVTLYTNIEANPTHQQINQGGEIAREHDCDVVIGLGGGSAMDAAKGIAVVATEAVDIWQIYEGAPITQPSLPVVAVPTTSGTGSEATFFAVVSQRELHRKEGFARPQFYPTLSIVDPQLTVNLPPDITAATGMDALSHAIEAYYCKFASPVVDVFAVEAIRLVAENLRQAVADGNDLQARSGMMLASTLAGMAITQADSCLAHVIGEAVGAVYNTGHGVSVAVSLPATMEYNCMMDTKKFANIARLLGAAPADLADEQAARLAPAGVRDLMRDIGLPMGLAALGVADLAEVMALVNRPGMDVSSPRKAGPPDYERLVQGSLSPAMSYWEVGGE